LAGIFISYRRSDSQGEAGRLFDDLVIHFGEQSVFMDVAAIEAGRDFRKAIEEGVTKCGVLLVLIGLDWLEAKDEHGARRLEDPSDFVRIETASALKRDIPVIPVLVRGAKMPSSEHLPEELKDLAYRNCIELTHARWRSDVQLLVEALRRLLGDSTPAGTSAADGQASASKRGTAELEGMPASKAAEEGFARIDATALERVTSGLAQHIGPIAGIVVKRAAAHCNSLNELYVKVSQEIDSLDEREDFLRQRTTILSIPVLNVAEAPGRRDRSPNASAPAIASVMENSPLPPAPPRSDTQSSGRQRYLPLLGGASVLIILVVVLVLYFAPRRGPGSSPEAQNVSRQLYSAAPAQSNTSKSLPAPVASAENDTLVPSQENNKTSQAGNAPSTRVRVTEKIADNLLIQPAAQPVYPVLARQAHIQGTVVLDADISKDGTVEDLRVLGGPPLLLTAALQAARQWRYRPYRQHGQPVAINTQISVRFAISNP